MRVLLLPGAIFSLTAASDGTYTTLGDGIASCGRWTAMRRAQHGSEAEQWVLGFSPA